MTRSNSVSLTNSCSNCGWYDDWCCSNSCGASWCNGCGWNGCSWNDGCGCSSGWGWNGGCGCDSCGCGSGWGCCGCSNGCGCSDGCLNGCTDGCVNGCGTCQNGCGSCGCNSCGSCGDGCGCSAVAGSSTACSSCGCGCSSCSVCSWLWPDAPALRSGGVLTSRIIGSGRLCQRVNELTLCMQDIPDAATAPFALLSVSASGPSDWEFISVTRWRAVLRVTIPLIARIRDCSGCVYNVHSSITVDVPVRLTIPTSDLGRAQVAVIPGVRLLCTSGCSEDGCFTVSLAVLVDVYVARWEPSADGVTIPCRPDLPLTLPASFHRGCDCWNSCGC